MISRFTMAMSSEEGALLQKPVQEWKLKMMMMMVVVTVITAKRCQED